MEKRKEGLGEKRREVEKKSVLYFIAYQDAKFEKTQRFFKLPWRIRARWFLWLALRYSNLFEKTTGLSKMDVEQLQWRSYILFKVHNFQKALRCMEEALSRELSTEEKAKCEINKGEILMAIGQSEKASEILNKAWQVRHQLSSEVMEDAMCFFMTCFLKMGKPSEFLRIYLEGEGLSKWRESIRN